MKVESQLFMTDAREVHVTGSFGVAICTEEYPHDSEELLRLADEALYRAKEQRNQSELASPVVVSEAASSKTIGRDWLSRAPWNEVRLDNNIKGGRYRAPLISLP